MKPGNVIAFVIGFECAIYCASWLCSAVSGGEMAMLIASFGSAIGASLLFAAVVEPAFGK